MNATEIVRTFGAKMTAETVERDGQGFMVVTLRSRVSEAGGVRFIDVAETFLADYDARITDVRQGGCIVVAEFPLTIESWARTVATGTRRMLNLDAIERLAGGGAEPGVA